MAPLDYIVFVRRQSPDWEALARDYEAGIPIDPSRYKPRTELPGFPTDIVGCIQAWNDTFPVNFFRCRQILKGLSEHCLHRISKSIITFEDKLADLPGLVADTRFLLFFFDDDDLFAPDTFERLSVLDLGQSDVAVFPLIRLGAPVFTLVRKGEPARIVVGARRDSRFRYQTNNYSISQRIAVSDHLPRLQDHVLGSSYADQLNLRDSYFDVLISATNKTPCSANRIGRLLANPVAYRASIRRYVEHLTLLPIPQELGWLSGAVSETVGLFSTM